MVIDCHAHYVAPGVISAVQEGRFNPELTYDESAMQFVFPTGRSRPFFSRMTELKGRIEYMNQLGVDVQILSTWIDVFGYGLSPAVARPYHDALNEGLARAVDRHPGRFRFACSVPLPHAEEAAVVLERSVRGLGALGAVIGTNIAGRNLDSAEFEPFWSTAENLDVPVILHPGNIAGANNLERYSLGNLLGNPFATTVAAASLILGGVLDRHPRLKIVLLHGGGYLLYALGRLDHGYAVREETHTSVHPPSTYLNRFLYDTILYRPELLDSLRRTVGSNRVVFGTDYPFDMEPPDAVGMVRQVFGSETDAVFVDTAAWAFGLRV